MGTVLQNKFVKNCNAQIHFNVRMENAVNWVKKIANVLLESIVKIISVYLMICAEGNYATLEKLVSMDSVWICA